jgi:hypothetical protein
MKAESPSLEKSDLESYGCRTGCNVTVVGETPSENEDQKCRRVAKAATIDHRQLDRRAPPD